MLKSKTGGRAEGWTGMTKVIGAFRDLRQLTYIVLRLIDYFVSQSIDLEEVDSTHTHRNTKKGTQTND
jgi:hypothetical protein